MDPLSVRQECHVKGIVGNMAQSRMELGTGQARRAPNKGPNISSQHGRCVEALSLLISVGI